VTARTPGLWRTIALDCKQEEGTYLAVESPLSFWWEPWPNKDASEKEAAFIVEACNSHDTLTADNARLREELEHLISIFGCQNAVDPGDDLSGDCKACSVCIARAALAKGGA
jgi:hypothetical protein